MRPPLEKITVAITEHRYTKEFTSLFERLGARVYACPVLQEIPVENRAGVENFVRLVSSGNLNLMIFLTGVGARFLMSAAESIGMKEQFMAALEKMKIVVRGPKPVAALRQFNIHIDTIPTVPTTEGVVEALRTENLQGAHIGIQLYGTPNPQLISALESRGATVVPVQVYSYEAAADSTAVNDLVEKLANRDIQVLAFTSAPQVRMLFEMASQLGLSAKLEDGIKNGVILASIGEVTCAALAEHGLSAQIVPKQPKMGAMAQAVADFFVKVS